MSRAATYARTRDQIHVHRTPLLRYVILHHPLIQFASYIEVIVSPFNWIQRFNDRSIGRSIDLPPTNKILRETIVNTHDFFYKKRKTVVEFGQRDSWVNARSRTCYTRYRLSANIVRNNAPDVVFLLRFPARPSVSRRIESSFDSSTVRLLLAARFLPFEAHVRARYVIRLF